MATYIYLSIPCLLVLLHSYWGARACRLVMGLVPGWIDQDCLCRASGTGFCLHGKYSANFIFSEKSIAYQKELDAAKSQNIDQSEFLPLLPNFCHSILLLEPWQHGCIWKLPISWRFSAGVRHCLPRSINYLTNLGRELAQKPIIYKSDKGWSTPKSGVWGSRCLCFSFLWHTSSLIITFLDIINCTALTI